jgi:hypothetical protein
VLHIQSAWDLFGAQAQHVRRGLLAVDDAKSPPVQLADKADEGDFRGVVHLRKHRLGEERGADGYSIQASHQLIALPGFD